MTKAWHLVCIGVFDDDMPLEKVGEFVETATNHKVTVQEVKPLPRELPPSDLPQHWMDRLYCLEDAVRELSLMRTAAHGHGGRVAKLERKAKHMDAEDGRLRRRIERLEEKAKEGIGMAGYSTIINRISELEDEVRLYGNGYHDLKRRADAFDAESNRTTDVTKVGWSFTCSRCHTRVDGPVSNPSVEWLCENCAEHDTVILPNKVPVEEE